jgi:hypothetical protein
VPPRHVANRADARVTLGHDPCLVLSRPPLASPHPGKQLDPVGFDPSCDIVTWHRHGTKPATSMGRQHPGLRQPALRGVRTPLTVIASATHDERMSAQACRRDRRAAAAADERTPDRLALGMARSTVGLFVRVGRDNHGGTRVGRGLGRLAGSAFIEPGKQSVRTAARLEGPSRSLEVGRSLAGRFRPFGWRPHRKSHS